MGSEDPPGRVALSQSAGMSEDQRLELDNVLKEHGEVICERLGQAVGTEHAIHTGQSPSIQAYPYRIAPNWKKELHDKVKRLLNDGIIVPITCPCMVSAHGTDSKDRWFFKTLHRLPEVKFSHC